MAKRKYESEYIKYGFISIENRGSVLPQCVICMKTLSNSSMKPSLLKRHLESNHASYKNRDASYFSRLGENVKKQRLDKTGQVHQKSADVVKASYEVALLVAKNKKAHTVAENLIMPAAKILVRRVIGDEAASKLSSVSVSNSTVKRRIEDMSSDIAAQLIAAVKESKFGFAIQLDESTDVTNCCQLLTYVRFTQDDQVKTDLLLSKELTTTTKGIDIFNTLNNFFEQNGLEWAKLVGCTTDGAPSMLGRRSGFQAHVKSVSPNVIGVHCLIHRFALSARVLPPSLLSCLKQAIKMVNVVKTSALNTRLFKALCEDVGSAHTSLIFYTEVRWLSRGNTLKRLFELRNEVLTFFNDKGHELANDLMDKIFIERLAYLSDIFDEINHLNLAFQGPEHTIVEFVSKLKAFLRKLDLWSNNISMEQCTMFKSLSSVEEAPTDAIYGEIMDHLKLLNAELKHYFPDVTFCKYITNPFSINPNDLPVGTGEQEELIDLQVDDTAKLKHTDCSPINFWLSIASSYPTLARHAIPQLLTFPSTWECEQGFSTMLTIKSKSRNRLLEPSYDFRCAVSKIEPRIDQIVDSKEIQKSH